MWPRRTLHATTTISRASTPSLLSATSPASQRGTCCDANRLPLGDEGFFYLSASPALHGWQLPASLRLSNGRTVVATRADARQKAIDDGVDRAV